MQSAAIHWDQLHEKPRFRPLYPNDHVVRFLMARRTKPGKNSPSRFLDIGTGAGRHIKLASELGFVPFGVDFSFVGLQHARQRLGQCNAHHGLAQASMLVLPFADGTFDLVLSFGVFYYGTAKDMMQAIGEAHRVLAPGGELFVVLRTTQDYRFGKGERLGPNTFRLKITDTNEYDTVQHFLAAEDIPAYFGSFSQLGFERTETTSAHRTRLDSDWLITAQK